MAALSKASCSIAGTPVSVTSCVNAVAAFAAAANKLGYR